MKKVLALLLAVALLCTCFAACGGDSGSSSSASSSEASQPESSQSSTADESSTPEESSEEQLLRELLIRYGYTLEGKKLIAAHMGISLRTLYRRLERFHI